MRHTGQSLVEYSVALGLVAVVAIGSVIAFGQTLGGTLDGIQGFFLGAPNTASPLTAGGSNSGSGTATIDSRFANMNYDKVTMDLGNGKAISFFAPAMRDVVDTAGGNGVTDRAAYILRQLADELKRTDPTVTEEEYQDLVRLSELGYTMRDIQKALEGAIPEGRNLPYEDDVEEFGLQTVVNYNGRQITFSELSSEIGHGLLKDPNTLALALEQNFQGIINQSVSYTDPALARRPSIEFTQLLHKIQNSNSFQNKPALKELVVNVLSKEIFNATMMTTNTYDKALIRDVLVPITGENSEAICGLSNSIQCQPKA
jgi:Flp pilus assembly pilin Flp